MHPEHLTPFQNLRDETCNDDLISLADLTPFAIRLVHENLEEGAPFCQGFDVATWLKPNQTVFRLDFKRKVKFALHVELNSVLLHVVTEVTLEYGVTAKSFQFSPAEGEFQEHSAQVCKYVNKVQIYKYDCSDIATQIHSVMVEKLDQLTEKTKDEFNSAHLMFWRHNLRFAFMLGSEAPRPAIIAYSLYGSTDSCTWRASLSPCIHITRSKCWTSSRSEASESKDRFSLQIRTLWCFQVGTAIAGMAGTLPADSLQKTLFSGTATHLC